MNILEHENKRILYEFKIVKNIENLLVLPCYPILNDTVKFYPPILTDLIQKSEAQNVDNSMLNDGIVYIDTYEETGDMYYLDTYTGLIYRYDGEFNVLSSGNFSSQHDIFDAAYFRQYLKDQTIKNRILTYSGIGVREIFSLDYMGYRLSDVFSVPILEYHAENRKELDEIINTIKSCLSQTRFFKKLWFRGQRAEYPNIRSNETIQKLGFNNGYNTMPSLVPSLGRNISLENYSTISNEVMRWKIAFKIWTLVQTKEYKDILGLGTSGYEEMMTYIEKDKLAEFIKDYPYDLSDYLINEYSEEKATILTTQQYGGYSSMLDITDDIDVAIFFTQSRLNLEKNKYELCVPTEKNVVYVFAEGRGTSTINISNDFLDLNNADYIPTRIKNQKCGLLTGANIFAKNTYAYRVIAKIYLKNGNFHTTKKVEELFPSKEKDPLYHVFTDIKPQLNGLYG